MAGLVSDAGADRFRTVATTRRAEIESTLRQARLLDPADQALLRAIYERGLSPGEFARAMGCSKRVIASRLKRIHNRLHSPMFRYVAQHEVDWQFDRRTIARSVILRGQTQRQAAKLLGVSVHYVRSELAAIKLLFEHETGPKSSSSLRSAPTSQQKLSPGISQASPSSSQPSSPQRSPLSLSSPWRSSSAMSWPARRFEHTESIHGRAQHV